MTIELLTEQLALAYDELSAINRNLHTRYLLCYLCD